MRDRLLWLDLIRAMSAQLIVLHHLALYGPIPERLIDLAPDALGWLREYARIAVQVFLVMSGFLLARSLRLERALPASAVWAGIAWRYVRLFIPFMAALGLVLLAAWPSRQWISVDWMPAVPDGAVLLAHLLGLYDYLRIEALTAGAWYVSIDLQLHALMLFIVWAAGRVGRDPTGRGRALMLMVMGLAALSLWWFNRDPAWDVTPLYFFGSFALGMASAWLGADHPDRPARRLAGGALIVLGLLALLLDYRLRIVVSASTALVLAWLARGAGARFDAALKEGRIVRSLGGAVAFLGDTAYALFLVHFPLCLLVNALYQRFYADSLVAALAGFALAWWLSLPLAALLHRFVEVPLQRRFRG